MFLFRYIYIYTTYKRPKPTAHLSVVFRKDNGMWRLLRDRDMLEIRKL